MYKQKTTYIHQGSSFVGACLEGACRVSLAVFDDSAPQQVVVGVQTGSHLVRVQAASPSHLPTLTQAELAHGQ